MQKIWNKIYAFKHFDKVLHFGVCLIATLSGSFVNIWLGVGLGVGLGLGKEVGDYYNPNSKFSGLDLVADAFGIVTGLLIKHYLL